MREGWITKGDEGIEGQVFMEETALRLSSVRNNSLTWKMEKANGKWMDGQTKG